MGKNATIKKQSNNCTCTIFTLRGFFNYGNRLQLFALSKILSGLGYKVTAYKQKDYIKTIKEHIKYNTPVRLWFKKGAKLRRFTKKYIVEKSDCRQTKYSIIGSDQVWNPDYYRSCPYLLEPLSNKRRISYAASLGVETLATKQKKQFKRALYKYKSISVRERSAQNLLQPLTDKKIEVVLDPTLLLDKSEYEQIERKPRDIKVDEKYILCYILGGRGQQNVIEQYTKDHDYKIILFSDKTGSDYGVEGFLYLIHHAQLICTDSFHTYVFSFIFDKPFVAFRRTGEADYMYSRLQT